MMAERTGIVCSLSRQSIAGKRRFRFAEGKDCVRQPAGLGICNAGERHADAPDRSGTMEELTGIGH